METWIRVTVFPESVMSEWDFLSLHSYDDTISMLREFMRQEKVRVDSLTKALGKKQYLDSCFVARKIRQKTGYKIYSIRETRLLDYLLNNPDGELPAVDWVQLYTGQRNEVKYMSDEGMLTVAVVSLPSHPITHQHFCGLVPGPIHP